MSDDSSFPSYDEIMCTKNGMKITPVKQIDINIVDIGKGICGGLSVEHIWKTLRANDSKPKNPFEKDKDILTSARIQENCGGAKECFKQTLENNTQFLTKPMKSFDNVDTLENELTKTVNKTHADHKSRGVFIMGDYERNPFNGRQIEGGGGHVFSLTTREPKQGLKCTVMDPNMFFSEGKNTTGCVNAIEQLVKTTKAYDVRNFNIIETTNRIPSMR